MKFSKTMILILFAVVIVILIFFFLKNIKNNNNTSQDDKLISEINYMDNKLTALLNSINNITLDNYKVSITKTSTNISSEENSNSSTGGESQSSQGEQTSQGSGSTNTTSEQYELKTEGILTGNSEVDWNRIKNQIEVLYSIIPTITQDLYNRNVNQDEILDFNKELDELTIAVKNEDKGKTLIKLANLYRYLPAYASNFSDDSEYVNILETKSNVFKAYVFVNIENWEESSNYINRAIQSCSTILGKIDNKNSNYDINKIYIVLNELQSSVNIKDKDVFLIKYKNFMGEVENHSIK